MKNVRGRLVWYAQAVRAHNSVRTGLINSILIRVRQVRADFRGATIGRGGGVKICPF